MMVTIPLQIGMIYAKSLLAMTLLVVFMGVTAPGRMQVTFVYACELVPNRRRTIIGGFILFFDASSILVLCGYFMYISKDWVYYQYASITLLAISIIAFLFFVPESACYLHSKGDFAGARKGLQYIASFNGVKDYSTDFLFPEELDEKARLAHSKLSAGGLQGTNEV